MTVMVFVLGQCGTGAGTGSASSDATENGAGSFLILAMLLHKLCHVPGRAKAA